MCISHVYTFSNVTYQTYKVLSNPMYISLTNCDKSLMSLFYLQEGSMGPMSSLTVHLFNHFLNIPGKTVDFLTKIQILLLHHRRKLIFIFYNLHWPANLNNKNISSHCLVNGIEICI
jgi:hypothetical protein